MKFPGLAPSARIVEDWRLILGQLPDPLAQSLAWRNAERIYAGPH